MEQSILDFPEQFRWAPAVVNGGAFSVNKFIICGMGGSHLAADLLKTAEPKLDLLIHRDYGLPRAPDYFLKESLIICCSYSGNTEETLDAFQAARAAGLQVAAVTAGGELLRLAQEAGVPYVQIPATGIQPRLALGYFLNALNVLMGRPVVQLALDLGAKRAAGEALASKLADKSALVYSSTANWAVAYNWKIKLNETGKTAAFYNVFPELNHNELESAIPGSGFQAIFLRDSNDDPRVTKRLELTAALYQERGLGVEIIDLAGNNLWEKIFNNLLLADWTALALAKKNGADLAGAVPVIEEFKKRLKN